MAYFDDHPQSFRIFLGILFAYLSIISAVNFYRYVSSPTDENLFSATPTNVYITKSFPAKLYDEGNHGNFADSIRVGDVLLNMNGKKFDRQQSLPKMFAELPKESAIDLVILRPSENQVKIYQVQKSALPDSFYRLLPPTAQVRAVLKDGASDRAGMKVGDLIFRVNGQDLKDYADAANDADAILRRGKIGKTIAYDVIRNNQTVTLHVKLAKFGIAIPLLIFCLTGLVYASTGAFIALQRPQFQAARLTGLALLLVGFFMAVVTLRRDAVLDNFVTVRNLMMALGALLGTAVWIHSGFYFPKERPELLAKPWLRYGLYTLALLAFIAAAFGPLDQSIIIGVLLLVLYNASAVHFWHRKHNTTEHKKLGRVIKWTSLIAGALSFIFMFLFDVQRLGGSVAGILLALIPLAYLYTIGRYHLLEMDLRVRRNIQYSIISLIWSAALLGASIITIIKLSQINFALPNLSFTGGTIEILDEPLAPEQRLLREKGILMVLAIVLSWLAWKIGRAGQRLLDKKYYRTQYDYRRAASDLADVMASKLSMVDIARGIVQKLSQIMRLKRAGVLFFRNQKACCCREAYGFDGAEWEEFCLAIDQKIVDVLQQFRSEVRFSVDYLPNGLKQALHQHGFRHVIPIRSKEKLVGALLIGEKRSETLFYQEDLEFLAAAAKQASVAVENAFLYEELAEQERLKHELEIARRIQLASLPQQTPQVDGLDIAGISIPAAEVGGDYFDYLNGVSNEIRVIIGDVSGKGTSAALYMSKVQGILRSLHGFGLSPKELFVRANQLLCQDLEKRSFVTSLGADFDAAARRLVFARAGHLPLFHYAAKTKHVEKITPKGLGLGLDQHGVFAVELEEKTLQYDAGDVFLFVTDGVTEAQSNGGKEFGEENVVKILASSSTLNAAKIRDGVINAVKQFAGNHDQHDDLTVVVVKAI
jgi:serine phosphatase RsbU (regulator of sigma subunit)